MADPSNLPAGEPGGETLEWAATAQVPALDRLVTVLALNREAADLGRLISEEARACRRDVHRELVTTVERLSRVRNERRPGSRYASPEQCRWELRRAKELFEAHRLPVVEPVNDAA